MMGVPGAPGPGIGPCTKHTHNYYHSCCAWEVTVSLSDSNHLLKLVQILTANRQMSGTLYHTNETKSYAEISWRWRRITHLLQKHMHT